MNDVVRRASIGSAAQRGEAGHIGIGTGDGTIG
jgi:hypothetical protein